jgi:hypothetical protein
MELIEVRRALLRSVDARRARVRHCPRDFAGAESKKRRQTALLLHLQKVDTEGGS